MHGACWVACSKKQDLLAQLHQTEVEMIDYVHETLLQANAKFYQLCLTLLQKNLGLKKDKDIITILNHMVRRIKDDMMNREGISDALLEVCSANSFPGLIVDLMNEQDLDVSLQSCRLLCWIFKVCPQILTISFDEDVRRTIIFERLSRCLSSDNPSLSRKARAVVVNLCNTQIDCSSLFPMITRIQNPKDVCVIANFLRLQLHFCPVTAETGSAIHSIWTSGNYLAKRSIIHGILWCAKHGHELVIQEFSRALWINEFTTLLTSTLYVDVVLGFRIFRYLWSYIDPADCPDDALFRTVIHAWTNELITCEQKKGCSNERCTRVCASIFEFLRVRVETNELFASDIILNDQFLISCILSGLLECNYEMREYFLSFLSSLLEKASSTDLLLLDVDRLFDGLLSMMPCVPQNILWEELVVFKRIANAHEASLSHVHIPSVFSKYNGPSIFEALLPSANEENSSLMRELLVTLGCES